MVQMKEVEEMPKDGQFVVVFVFEGRVWSHTFRYENGVLMEYIEAKDGDSGFELASPLNNYGFLTAAERKFFING